MILPDLWISRGVGRSGGILVAQKPDLALREGHLLLRSADAAPGDAVRIALAEGWLEARVTGRDMGEDPLPGRQGGRAPEEGSGGQGGGGR